MKGAKFKSQDQNAILRSGYRLKQRPVKTGQSGLTAHANQGAAAQIRPHVQPGSQQYIEPGGIDTGARDDDEMIDCIVAELSGRQGGINGVGG